MVFVLDMLVSAIVLLAMRDAVVCVGRIDVYSCLVLLDLTEDFVTLSEYTEKCHEHTPTRLNQTVLYEVLAYPHT